MIAAASGRGCGWRDKAYSPAVKLLCTLTRKPCGRNRRVTAWRNVADGSTTNTDCVVEFLGLDMFGRYSGKRWFITPLTKEEIFQSFQYVNVGEQPVRVQCCGAAMGCILYARRGRAGRIRQVLRVVVAILVIFHVARAPRRAAVLVGSSQAPG